MAESRRARYQRLKQEGRCGCGQPLWNGYAHCKKCVMRYSEYHLSERKKERTNKRRQQCREQGICTYCKKCKADKGYSRCASCREKFRVYSAQARKRRGVMTPAEKKAVAERWDERCRLGLCRRCGEKPVDGRVNCQKCINKARLYQRSYRARKRAEEVLNKEAKLARCVVCRRKFHPIRSTHIVCRSQECRRVRRRQVMERNRVK